MPKLLFLSCAIMYARLHELSEAFDFIQNEVIKEGIRIVKTFEKLRDGDKVDFSSKMSHADMVSLCTNKSGFIIWLTDDFELRPKVIVPSDNATGASDMAKVARFLCSGVVAVGDDIGATYTKAYFYGLTQKKMLISEYEFMKTYWSDAKSVVKWRR